MTPLTCRHCGAPLPEASPVCPQCGKAQGAAGREWSSSWRWMGYPVVHLAWGCDAEGRPRKARGVIAIGQNALGGIAVGIVARGFLAIGLVAMGLFSFGVVSVAAIVACGVNAVAPVAIGLTAFGYMAGGLAAFSWKTLF